MPITSSASPDAAIKSTYRVIFVVSPVFGLFPAGVFGLFPAGVSGLVLVMLKVQCLLDCFRDFPAVFFIMSKTRTGRHIYAIGSNVEAAKLSGVNVFATTKAYLISAFCAAVVGLILAGQAGMGNMEAGTSYERYGVAAGVIGGISPLGGSGLLLGAFAGAGVWQTLENGLGIIGTPVGIQRIVIGVIVAGAVLIDVVFRQGAKKVKK